ncbi:Succinyl-CoA:3-ketoacid-coenzyme A transferase [Tolypocladium paradoxum]|uniref:Succinyl-CoA:3-ketoacid-coenzyme A transferase n=1 Tax=Tolypocladium paradoxum TaxID=94208 RepID=A0A2S4L747_9HYPO|nr:Succinyl-CoA:3-ketoacid-coenzyme A transferase [Tolypocladium paradoxum]
MAVTMRPMRAAVLPRATPSSPTLIRSVSARLLAPRPGFPRRSFATTTIRFSRPQRRDSKVFATADDAVADVRSGSTILSSGFGLCGVVGTSSPLLPRSLFANDGAETLIEALNRRGADALHSLTAVSNNAGMEGLGGLSILTKAGRVDRLILSYLGNNKALEKKYLSGELAVELCPQGTLAERLRAGGAGIPAFFTPTGARRDPDPARRLGQGPGERPAATRVVSTIITDLCVFQVDREKGTLTLTELAPGVDVEYVRSKTEAEFGVAEDVTSME